MRPDRYFTPDPAQKSIALSLYETVAALPLICPHGHVEPQLFSQADYRFGSPVELLLHPDHYLVRMLYSQGISLEALGIPRRDGAPVETDGRRSWRIFAEHFYLFHGTPSGLWLRHELEQVLGITAPLNAANADLIYDQINACLAQPTFTPRRLYEQFQIEVLCTTDAATDSLTEHQAIRNSGWGGRILPTFRPDAVVNLETANWTTHLDQLSAVSGITIHNYATFMHALEQRRTFFKHLGATATDHAARTPYTTRLTPAEAETIFQRALHGQASAADAAQWQGHLLLEMARLSLEDGLVMQLHVGSYRNHNSLIFEQFGADRGADIPLATEFTRNLQPLLAAYGNDPRLTLILFTLDETTYSRELAPLAGHYPALRVGPPWWFHDSWNGMQRYFDQLSETAGWYNMVGFNDDTRAFLSIPARHDVWRRAVCDWLAGRVVRGMLTEAAAYELAHTATYDLAKKAYRL
jgi:glucuronate isomerase